MIGAKLGRWIVVSAWLLAGCAAGPRPSATGFDAATWAIDTRRIERAIEASAEAWNRGDLRGHLSLYVDTVTFMTANGPEPGVEAVEAAFRATYFQDGLPRQTLGFESIRVRPLGPDAALSTGRFVLSGGGEPDQTGWFTLVWQRTPEGWRAVHDHSG